MDKAKVKKIIYELISFLIEKKIYDINISLIPDKSHVKIEISCPTCNTDNISFDELENIISVPRLTDIENLYWQLLGDTDENTQLFLLGSMIDNIDINKSDKGLKVTIYRLYEQGGG